MFGSGVTRRGALPKRQSKQGIDATKKSETELHGEWPSKETNINRFTTLPLVC